jgi:hypothetical protein
MGHGRRDVGELLVALLVDPGVGADDEVGSQGGDPLVLEAVGAAQDLRLGVAQRVLGPRPGGEGLVAVPVGDAHRDHAERQDRVLLGDAHRHDPLRLLGHLGLAERVLDGERERTRSPAALRRLDLVVAAGARRDRQRECDDDQGVQSGPATGTADT